MENRTSRMCKLRTAQFTASSRRNSSTSQNDQSQFVLHNSKPSVNKSNFSRCCKDKGTRRHEEQNALGMGSEGGSEGKSQSKRDASQAGKLLCFNKDCSWIFLHVSLHSGLA
ncbi:hypothetical protein GOP47_0023784 [Adiantum capillus-veneris]|uniref:Uncharacterized protein n=1 Tax=Adiantum capillus-veneris TaxID=13818 RepID=A0A9D4U449_ADICA|nr:hypothetical protein GOP47_0023784 [Adiantum capillus-veneris]